MHISDFYPDDDEQVGFPLPFDKRHRGKLVEMLMMLKKFGMAQRGLTLVSSVDIN